MNVHEYQAKAILRKFGVPVPDGHVCYNGASAREWAKRLGEGPWVVKAQIHAGGRGKGGGVKLARTSSEVQMIARDMLGMTLRTHQTGPEGKVVHRVLVENGCNIANELYVSFLVDRGSSRVTVMASTEGGMDIEEVAANTPEKIVTEAVDPLVGLTQFQCRKIAFSLGLKGKLTGKAVKVLTNLYATFIACDCSLLEINPLVVTAEGELIALDAKFGFDDNALFRHLQIGDMRDFDEEDPNEIEASQHDLSYISLSGNIGCLVNGAGLAMATMDIIKHYGGDPANFLDVGGGATIERVTEAFKIILSDKNVKGILVNIFGGIMKCDVIATGVIEAARQVGIQVPLVVRLEGTNVELGKKLLAESGLNIVAADGMADGAQKIVAAVAAAA
ncbi:ADP-forming succinate--CoA ligase subunit beta [Geomonas sp. Red69]|uniref:Succinate--CoA ligase [ADP-forming] subunit beta n=1 Tax=Geomonas diazotrophica TaxID=2843197 RepID=A0ABX8JMM9_9BACT|nr:MULTISPECIES: ADP-forming succinate--CoA ligase subunit beta [Geomonas]MBU5636774.1 ADP-forming succinate--CoA ligase subunit beta [Geomonas diazotrophica]QWV98416.1 ADP-forming succinate--CoA ligase subunit beta [Geomonas nitrogeniifigens]QXE87598.1 ADP-forming succinate--CoA ligase subunit beta [Geomonas nitrogeniifigens]